MASTTNGRMPAVGYEVASCVLCFNVTSLKSKVLFGTAGYVFRRIPNFVRDKATTIERSTIRLNARNLKIESVRLDGVECRYLISDPLVPLASSSSRDLSSISAGLTSGLLRASEGELVIIAETELTADTVTLEIDYEILDGVAIFSRSDVDHEDPAYFDEHMYTRVGFAESRDLGAGCGARCLFPCVDSFNSRHPFKFFIETNREHTAIAPGTLIRTSVTSDTSHVFEFDHTSPMPVYGVGFAVGRFEKIEHPGHPWFTTYALSSRAERLKTLSVRVDPCVTALLEYIGQGGKGLSSYSQVFVAGETVFDTALVSSSFAVLSDDFCFEYDIEYVSPQEEAHALLSQCIPLAAQWFGYGSQLGPCAAGEVWVPLGLSMMVALQAIRLARGDAAYYGIIDRWMSRTKKTLSRSAVVNLHHSKPGVILGRQLSGPMPFALPVDYALWASRGVSIDSTFAEKAGLTMHMLEQRASSLVFRNVVSKLAATAFSPKFSVSSAAGSGVAIETKFKMLSELAFLTLLKSRAGPQAHDIDPTFIAQWLRHNYIPKFSGEVQYNPKLNRIEIILKQELVGNGRLYTGAIKVRVVERQGTWEYEKQIDSLEHKWIFECRSTKARGKGGRKAKVDEERNEQWRNVETLDAAKLLSMSSSTSGKTAKKTWDSSSPVHYVLLDPESAWIMDLRWKQPEEFWLEMLHDSALRDNTVVQKFAVHQLARHNYGKEPASHYRGFSTLAGIAGDPTRNEEVRVAAVLMLLQLYERFCPSAVSGPGNDWTGMQLILFLFKQLYCDPAGEPLPFSAKDGQYSVRSVFFEVLSLIKAQDGNMPEEIRNMLFESMRQCDNSGNTFDDGPLLAGLAIAAGNLLASQKTQLGGLTAMGNDDESETLRWLKSTLDFDAVAPSPRNHKRATVGCLEALLELELSGKVKVGTTNFASYLQDPFWKQDPGVRLTAFECILQLHVINRASVGEAWMNIMQFLLETCANEACGLTKTRMIKLLLNAHAETIDREWPELNGNKDMAGCFYPLMKRPDTMDAGELEKAQFLVHFLFKLINEHTAYNPGFRIMLHQFWRLVWNLNEVGPVVGMFTQEDLGPLENWVDEAEREYQRDEKTMIHFEDFKKIQEKQEEMVRDQEAKRQKKEETASSTTTTTTFAPPLPPPIPASAVISQTKPVPMSVPKSQQAPERSDEDMIVVAGGTVQGDHIMEEADEEILEEQDFDMDASPTPQKVANEGQGTDDDDMDLFAE